MDKLEKNTNKYSNNELEQIQNKIDKTITKGENIVDSVKQGGEVIIEINSEFQNTLNNANNLAQSVNGVKDSFIESKKIQASTEIKLKEIQSNHQKANRIITEEYGKQKQQMNKASDVVDAGLQQNDLEKIREGLNAMTSVANHNPMDQLKKSMDKKLKENLNKDLNDDDFIIEI